MVIAPFLNSPDPLDNLQFDVSLGNPPFNKAMSFIDRSLKHAQHVVMLLRLNFLGSQIRHEFMSKYPPDVYLIPDRPSFDGEGTDSIEYGWMHWDRTNLTRPFGKVYILGLTSKEEKRLG